MAHHAQIFFFRYRFTCMSISLSYFFINPFSLLNARSFHGEGFQPMTRSFTKYNNFYTPITKLWYKQLITPLYLRLCYMIPISIFSFYKWGNRFVDAKNSANSFSWWVVSFVLKPGSDDAGHPAPLTQLHICTVPRSLACQPGAISKEQVKM